MKKFGRYNVLQTLMPENSRYMGGVKIAVESFAIAALVIMLARPIATNVQADTTDTLTSKGIELMVCLDVSNSMLASSTSSANGQSRLAKAKNILEKIIDKMSNDRIGLIVFAGDAYMQLPITSDYVSAKMFLSGINTDMVSLQGTAIGAALNMAENAFSPESKLPKAIVLITDVENFEDDAVAAAKQCAKNGIRVDVIGVGTPEGSTIPVNATKTEFMRDNEGNEVITALNPALGEEIARAGDGIYLSGNSTSVVAELQENLDDLGKSEFIRKIHSPAAEQFNVFAWLALCIIIIDIFILNRKISWLSGYNFFTKSK